LKGTFNNVWHLILEIQTVRTEGNTEGYSVMDDRGRRRKEGRKDGWMADLDSIGE